MKTYRLSIVILAALLMAVCAAPILPTRAQEGTATTPGTATEVDAGDVDFVCSEGDVSDDCAGGTVTIRGTATSGNVAFMPDLYPNPSVVLIDVSNIIGGEYETFVPETGQILGVLTTPLFPGPGEIQISLPISHTAASIDLDNDGEEDPGVQIYALSVASNLINNSYLQQLEQTSGLGSYILDVTTGAITQGTFLVYAPDGEQGFPADSGADGQWFTGDDPAFTLPAGYSVVTLGTDGSVTVDRSPAGVINTIERAEAVSPDFSDQGILESYNSLIDTLEERYAYTELRSLDWEEIRSRYLADVEAADANEDIPAYFAALNDLAVSIQDSHVSAVNYVNVDALLAPILAFREQTGGTVGASVIAVSDEVTPTGTSNGAPGDTIVVLTVGEESPAAEAGWVPGTEIISINGEPPTARYGTLPTIQGVGAEEARRVGQSKLTLSFPPSQTVTIGYRLPDTSEVLTATMQTGAYETGEVFVPDATTVTPVTYEQRGDTAILRWNDFIDYILPKIYVLEEALAIAQSNDSSSVIIDMRGNGGGWVALYETMASYFFTADDPMPVHVFDEYYFDNAAGEHIRAFAPDYMISAPVPELAFTGPLVILVDEHCASSCEYFTQHLQSLGRATVVSQYGTSGAGGFIDRIALPGGTTFQFTQGQTTFVGTDEPNLEAKGVVPDIRVPVTVETELAKMRGEDPVLDAALAVIPTLAGPAAGLAGTTWQWTVSIDLSQETTAVEEPERYTLTFADDGTVAVGADCNRAGGTYTQDEENGLTISLGPTTLALCPPDSRSEELLQLLGSVTGYALEDSTLALLLDPDTDLLAIAFETAVADDEPSPDAPEAQAETITGIPWQLVEIQYMDDTVETPTDPAQYTLLLNEDGTAAVQLDCNSGSGTYELDGSQLSFGPIASTMMACPPESLADAYAQGLTDATSYVLEDGDLYIAFGPDAGILHFTPAETAAEGTAVLPSEPSSESLIEATFVCPDGTSIDAVFNNAADTVTVTLPDATITLPRAVSGSGARYSDDVTTFWNNGNEALVQVNGETVYEGCVEESQ